MDVSRETIEILVLLLPGFLFIKIVSLRCSLKQYEAHHYIIDALIVSLIIYSLVKLLGVQDDGAEWASILSILLLTIALAFIFSVVINRDWMSKVLHRGGSRLSTHSSIFPVKAIEEFKGKWHLIRFADGKEIVGVLKEFHHGNCEALVKDARLVLRGGKLSPDKAWYYVPPGEHIVYIRTLEEKG